MFMRGGRLCWAFEGLAFRVTIDEASISVGCMSRRKRERHCRRGAIAGWVVGFHG